MNLSEPDRWRMKTRVQRLGQRYLKISILVGVLALAGVACTRTSGSGEAIPLLGVRGTSTPFGPIPTAALLLPSATIPPTPAFTPTPDQPHPVPTLRSDPSEYVVQAGDTLGLIARGHNVSIEAITAANNLADPNLLSIGQSLLIPPPQPRGSAPGYKIIPDSEMVLGPASADFEAEVFIRGSSGHLATYIEEVNGELMTGAQIVERVAQNYSVSPRLLLALLEHRSSWVTNTSPEEETLQFPLGLYDARWEGLYRQLAWTADMLNRGYYAWRAGALGAFITLDGELMLPNPNVNAGTAAVQYLFAIFYPLDEWRSNVRAEGLAGTYTRLFGDPFSYSVDPLIPPGLEQPVLQLPFEPGEVWAFTGGPHGGWDNGSAWAALDFAPPGEPRGCVLSAEWVTAVADGLIVRAGSGAVIQDLDGDGLEQTGWTVLYMHIDESERVRPGARVKIGDRIGHPSCEGGISSGTHLHIARRYNGEWIAAGHPQVPFVLDGWTASGTGVLYDGYLTRGSEVVEAFDGNSEINEIQR